MPERSEGKGVPDKLQNWFFRILQDSWNSSLNKENPIFFASEESPPTPLIFFTKIAWHVRGGNCLVKWWFFLLWGHMRIMCAVAESNPSTADSAEWARSNISSSITHTLTFFDFRCRIGNNQVPSESKVNKRSVIFFFSRRRRQHGPYNPVASFQRAAEAREYLKNYKTDVSKIAGRVRVKRKQGEFNFFFANEASPPTPWACLLNENCIVDES